MSVTILTLVIGEDYRTGLAEALQSKVDYARQHGMYIRAASHSQPLIVGPLQDLYDSLHQ